MKVYCIIEVKEKNTNNFDGIIGYIPPGKNENTGYITGLVNISLRNLFGTGRAAAIKWNKYNRDSQELDLKYLEPWLLSYPLNINLELYQRVQDTTYVQRKLEGCSGISCNRRYFSKCFNCYLNQLYRQLE